MKTKIPRLFYTVGLPGSSKSTWLESNKEKLHINIHSSDSIREEMGDINDQTRNELVFSTLHKRVKEDLLNGKNVAYDATNLKRKNRLAFMREIQNIPCEKICVLFCTPYEICLKNNANRERKVPENVIERMYLNYEAPWYSDGFDEIQIVWWNYEKDDMEFDYKSDLKKWCNIEHNNPNHKNSIGNHMIKAYEYMCDKTDNFLLKVAASMHDCGKIYTKKFIDSKGNPCDTAHFYQHHCCGSYDSLFYLKNMFNEEWMQFKIDDILYISLLIGLHMKPFLSWDKSDKAKEKDKKIFGDDIINHVEILHEADLYAH